MKQSIFTTLFLTLIISGLHSQSSPDSVLRDLVNTYRSVDGLSCDIQYKYASAKSADKYVDSLKGRYITKGADVWFEIDQTISIKNNEYSIAIFKEDEIIYVGKATDSLCKNITYVIEKKSGLLLKTIAVVSTTMLYEEGAAPKNSRDEFSNIETVFSNYKLGNVNPAIFKTESYLSSQSDELKPSKDFNSYKIIKAKPKL